MEMWRRFSEMGLLLLALAGSASVWQCTLPAQAPAVEADTRDALSLRLSRVEESGRRIYVSICAYCHGEKGDGFGLNASNLATPPRDHTDAAYMNSRTDEQLFAVIKQGGAAQGNSALMPPWRGRLTDREITALVSYVRTLSRVPIVK